MAEKKGGKKKKLLWGLLSIAVVVVAVVMLIVFLPKGKTTADNLKEVSQTSIADNEESKADYITFQDKVKNTSGVQYYYQEVVSIRQLTETLDDVVDFYNDYYLFAQDNGYNGQINDGLDFILKYQKILNQILVESKKDVGAGLSIVQNTWVEYRANYAQLLRGYKDLISGINKAYHTAMGNVLVTNVASKMILNTVDDYIEVILNDIDKLVSTNLSGSKESTYSLGNLGAKIQGFGLFVKEYVLNVDHIQKYYINNPTQFSTVEKFEQMFKDDIKSIIDSIEYLPALTVTYTNQIADESVEASKVLSTTKTFVLGGKV